MSDSRKRSKISRHFNKSDNTRAEYRVCKIQISYRAGSMSNLHRHMRTVHPSVQLEEKRQASEPAINEGAGVCTAATAALCTASSRTPPQPPKPTTHSSMSQFLQKSLTPAGRDTIDEELAKTHRISNHFQSWMTRNRGFRHYSCTQSSVCNSKQENTPEKSSQAYMTENALRCKRGLKKATAVCLTTDSETSRNTTSYLSVTCHSCPVFWIVLSSVTDALLRT